MDVVKLLISNGAEVEPQRGPSALYYAAAYGHLPVVKYMVSLGVSVDTPNGKLTPLWSAARDGAVDVVEYLHKKGADVNRANEYRRTPLFSACALNRLAVVEYLVTHGAKINQAAEYGQTQLSIAADYNYGAVIDCLIEHGADMEQRDDEGQTPLYLACTEGSLEATMKKSHIFAILRTLAQLTSVRTLCSLYPVHFSHTAVYTVHILGPVQFSPAYFNHKPMTKVIVICATKSVKIHTTGVYNKKTC